MTSFTYAPEGSEAFNEAFGAALESFSEAVKASARGSLAGLVLCGGYGRGEGAVSRHPEAASPGGFIECAYNDVDLLPVANKGGTADLAAALTSCEGLRAAFETRWRADLDVGRPLEVAALSRLPASLMWIEVARGHRVLAGPGDLFLGAIGFDPGSPVPPSEAARLLLNRGAGLLMAVMKSKGYPPESYDCSDPDFVRRNWMKSRLAIGDALAIASACHSTPIVEKLDLFFASASRIRSVLERSISADAKPGELEKLFNAAAEDYRAGVAFKLAPDAFPGEPGSAELLAECALWLRVFIATESARTGKSWNGPTDYSSWTGLREPAEHRGLAKLARNIAHNLKSRDISALYPREKLYRTLPSLLSMVAGGAALPGDLAESFLALWKRYN